MWNSASMSPPATAHGDSAVDEALAAASVASGRASAPAGAELGSAVGMNEPKEWYRPWAAPSWAGGPGERAVPA
ncbi:hypothetical protein ACWGI1_23610, partial [Streptomyces sp. NPDC054835]